MNKIKIIDMLEQGLNEAKKFTDPFPLLYFKPFFDDFYDEILLNLPDTKYYDPFTHTDLKEHRVSNDGTFPRMLFSLENKSIDRLDQNKKIFWHEFKTIMLSNEVLNLFLNVLKDDLTSLHGKNFIDTVKVRSTIKLGRDFKCYKIKPHPDSHRRIYTAQVYLPRDAKQKFAGTTIYKKLRKGKFEEIKTLPYVPNRGFLFPRSELSWHGVKTLNLDSPRDNLHISGFYYDAPQDKWDKKYFQ
jgi:hypothetical protein